MAAPPLLAGAVQVMLPAFTAAAAVPVVGAPGAVFAGACGVTGAEALLVALPETPLAVTLKVTGTPLVRPLTIVELAVPGTVVDATWVVPANAATVNEVIPVAPAGSDHVTRALALNAVAVTLVGAAGAPSERLLNCVQAPVFASRSSQNRRFSTLVIVSTPSVAAPPT